MRYLITGGAGYIGSHTAISLLQSNHEVVIYDNFSADTYDNINRIEIITGKKPTVVIGDIRDTVTLSNALIGCDAIMHAAAKKIAGESEKIPLEYFDHNVSGLLSVIKAAKLANVRKIVFASSAHIYGSHSTDPIPEATPLYSDNTYGMSKKMDEEILGKMSIEGIDVICLRYFNIAGAHESGFLGDKMVPPKNLFAKMALCVDNKGDFIITKEELEQQGKKYIKDYVHIQDIADANKSALEYISVHSGLFHFNIGSGKGTSIFEFIELFEKVVGKKFNYTVVDRPPFDTESTIADTTKTANELGWVSKKSPEDIIRDLWQWYCAEYKAKDKER